MSILAIIPARGGSKGIPEKNIYPVGGKPLMVWTIEAAKKSRYISQIAVSSDSDTILHAAKHYGAIPVKRPDHLATDTAPPEPVIFHALEYMERNHQYIPETIIYLQPTSPLRDEKHIDDAFGLYFDKQSKALLSVVEVEKKYLKTFIDEKGYLKPASRPDFPFANRQELPSVFLSNGAIYIIERDEFLKTKKLYSEKTIPFVMSPEHSIDIDTLEDIARVEEIFKKQR